MAWWQVSGTAWTRLRALPIWAQFLVWLLAWPVAVALFVARDRRLGPLAIPVTVAVVLCGGVVWWPLLFKEGTTRAMASGEAVRWASPASGLGASALAPTARPTDLPEFDPATLDVEIAECVQTRITSTVPGTIRQPRIVARVTNHGPARTVALRGAVLLQDYDWNGGWKPTATGAAEMSHGQTLDVTLLTDYRHQSSYQADGLHACRLLELEFVAPQVWPEYPARQVVDFRADAVAEPERDYNPERDVPRTDAR